MPMNNATEIRTPAIKTDAAILFAKTNFEASFSCFRSNITAFSDKADSNLFLFQHRILPKTTGHRYPFFKTVNKANQHFAD